MQVLENAVKKLKMPSHVEEVSTRIEPRFETTTPKVVEPRIAHMSDTTPSPDPIPLSAVRAASTSSPVKDRGPLFSDLPDPDFEDEAPMSTDTGGSGGGGSGAKPRDEERRFGPWLTGLGAVASIALVVGVSIWTFKLGQRDAREVPIVAALEGPARVAPDDAGGLQVAHQGHSVNSVLNGQGVEQVAAAVTVAPADNDLRAEDAPAAELSALVASRVPQARPAENATGTESVAGVEASKPLTPNGAVVTPTETAEIEAELPPQTAIAGVQTPLAPEAIADQILTPADEIAAAKPEVEAIAEPVTVAETGETGAADPVTQPAELEVAALGPLPPLGEGSIYAPAVMKTPQARPADLNVAMANAVNAALETVLAESTTSPEIVKPEAAEAPVTVAAATEAAPTGTLDTIPLPDGTRMIQIGAYGSEAVARQQWDRLSSQHEDLLGTKDHYVQRTNNSGKVFYRLRVAGYDNKSDTQSACAALSARGLPCITVTLQ